MSAHKWRSLPKWTYVIPLFWGFVSDKLGIGALEAALIAGLVGGILFAVWNLMAEGR